jgi:hypothetical protein
MNSRLLSAVLVFLMLASATSAQRQKVMLFGGRGHKTYLGCLNCNKFSSDSIFNTYGTNGSPYSSSSIWNHYSEYGSKYSDYSTCNPYATDPPVIVDAKGNFYGRLTANKYHAELGGGAKLMDLVGAACGE